MVHVAAHTSHFWQKLATFIQCLIRSLILFVHCHLGSSLGNSWMLKGGSHYSSNDGHGLHCYARRGVVISSVQKITYPTIPGIQWLALYIIYFQRDLLMPLGLIPVGTLNPLPTVNNLRLKSLSQADRPKNEQTIGWVILRLHLIHFISGLYVQWISSWLSRSKCRMQSHSTIDQNIYW